MVVLPFQRKGLEVCSHFYNTDIPSGLFLTFAILKG